MQRIQSFMALAILVALMSCNNQEQDFLKPEDLVGDYCGNYTHGPISNNEISLSEDGTALHLSEFLYAPSGLRMEIENDSIIIPYFIDTLKCYLDEDCKFDLEAHYSGSGIYNKTEDKLLIKYRIYLYLLNTGNLYDSYEGYLKLKKESSIDYTGTYHGIEADSNTIVTVSKMTSDTSYVLTLLSKDQEKYLLNNSLIGSVNIQRCAIYLLDQQVIMKETSDTLNMMGYTETEYLDNNDEIFKLSLWEVHKSNSGVWYSPFYSFKGMK
jgi:hypothetical protein